MTYERLIESSARWHVDHVRRQLGSIRTASVGVLAKGIIDMTSRALAERARMATINIPVTLGRVGAALHGDREATMSLLNEHALGLGNDAPLAVFMGKEHAYEPDSELVNFVLEAVALSTLWLTDGSRDVLRAILETPGLDHVDFLRRPGSLLLGGYLRAANQSGQTWHKVARVLEHRLGTSVTFESWGDHAYLVELNTVPSKHHRRLAPSEVRVGFLCEMMRVFRRGGTRTLVLHSQEPHHRSSQERISAAFLGVDTRSLPMTHRIARRGSTPGQRIETWDHGGARVIRCRQLGNSIADDLLRDVGDLIVGPEAPQAEPVFDRVAAVRVP